MSPVNEALSTLMNEVLEGTPPGASGTYFVQGTEALWATLEDLSAEEASRRPSPSVASVAAHVVHTTYYLELTLDLHRGIERQGDWEGSWKRQSVNEEEWQMAMAGLRAKVQDFLAVVPDTPLDNLDYATGGLANLAHLAYHLGAIRQIYLMVKEG